MQILDTIQPDMRRLTHTSEASRPLCCSVCCGRAGVAISHCGIITVTSPAGVYHCQRFSTGGSQPKLDSWSCFIGSQPRETFFFKYKHYQSTVRTHLICHFLLSFLNLRMNTHGIVEEIMKVLNNSKIFSIEILPNSRFS